MTEDMFIKVGKRDTVNRTNRTFLPQMIFAILYVVTSLRNKIWRWAEVLMKKILVRWKSRFRKDGPYECIRKPSKLRATIGTVPYNLPISFSRIQEPQIRFKNKVSDDVACAILAEVLLQC